MATTPVVAEILIAGLQALVWISLLILTLFGGGWIDVEALNSWEALTTIFVLAAAYVLGILVDRAADSGQMLLTAWWPEPDVRKPDSVAAMRTAVRGKGGDAAIFLEYQRSRLRVARATVFNLLIALPVATAFLIVRTDIGAGAAAVTALLALALVLAQLAYRRIQAAYLRGLGNAYCEVTGSPDSEVAAAVPYRWNDDLEFLLVRTKGGRRTKRWTFPKGHQKRKRDATLADTAMREAREEAGIEGTIEGGELGTFAYPADDREDDTVHAYLLRVDAEGQPVAVEERRRDPRWVTVDDARRLLAEGGREARYARGMHAILEAAVGELRSRCGR